MRLTPGMVIGRLTVLERLPWRRPNRMARLRVRCSCGTIKTVREADVDRGLTRSCGCLQRELAKRVPVTHGHTRAGRWSPLYIAWKGILARCTNPRNRSFKNYGARGIDVHPAWLDFGRFAADVGERPTPRHSIDRIDNNRGYEPGNVRWATRQEQSANRRTNRLLSFRGETKPLVAWARELGFEYSVLQSRMQQGWAVERALTEPVHTEKRKRRAA